MMMSVVRIGTCRGATYGKSGVSRDSVLTIPGRVLEENNRFLGIEDDSSHLKDPPSRPEDNTTLLLGNTSETPCVLADLLSRSIKGKTVAMEGVSLGRDSKKDMDYRLRNAIPKVVVQEVNKGIPSNVENLNVVMVDSQENLGVFGID
ncbi:hypothetical protein ACOSQ3_009680 [Xanthoceras sorbifolium]